jgi:hypothetical protein
MRAGELAQNRVKLEIFTSMRAPGGVCNHLFFGQTCFFSLRTPMIAAHPRHGERDFLHQYFCHKDSGFAS